MNPRENVRSNMVEGAVRLLASRGVEGTSFSEVLAAADAPRGSVYHHFPGGKSELSTPRWTGPASELLGLWRRPVARRVRSPRSLSCPVASTCSTTPG